MEGSPKIIKNEILNKRNVLERQFYPVKNWLFEGSSFLLEDLKRLTKKTYILLSFTRDRNLPFLNKSIDRIKEKNSIGISL